MGEKNLVQTEVANGTVGGLPEKERLATASFCPFATGWII